MERHEEVQDRIRKRRKQIGLTTDELAKKMGVAQSTVSRYEKKDASKLPMKTLIDIAQALNCTVGYLIGTEGHDTLTKISPLEIDMLTVFRTMSPSEQRMILRAFGIDIANYFPEGKKGGTEKLA